MIRFIVLSLVASSLCVSGANLDDVLEEARGHMARGQYEAALKLLDSVAEAGQQDGKWHYLRAGVYSHTGNLNKAEFSNIRAFALNPKLVSALYNNACVAARQRQAGRALNYLEAVADALRTKEKRQHFHTIALKDTDFEWLREQPGFSAVVERIGFGMPEEQYHIAAAFDKTIQATMGMVHSPKTRKLAQAHKLRVMTVTWEDTGRYKNSAVGPNISDMTIQVANTEPDSNRYRVRSMPVIRHPNFSDKTADLDPRDFTLLVGNHTGGELKRISLYDFLEDPTRYLSKPGSWKATTKSLLAPRDSKVLVSAQACFLPIPKKGKAQFNPVLFNYQSGPKNPAVLTVLATRQGTSVTIIDNERDAFDNGDIWGQRLFHNASGMRASLTGERKSDFLVRTAGTAEGEAAASSNTLNMVLLIQIPLKHKAMNHGFDSFGAADEGTDDPFAAAGGGDPFGSDVEEAVIGHGEVEGPFTEIDNLKIERDPRFPVRVTVQFYKATSNGVVSTQDMKDIASQLDAVYDLATAVGSLVTQGDTGRITEYDGAKVQPADWWEAFWKQYEANTGRTRVQATKRLMKLLGVNYRDFPVCDLYLRTVLAE